MYSINFFEKLELKKKSLTSFTILIIRSRKMLFSSSAKQKHLFEKQTIFVPKKTVSFKISKDFRCEMFILIVLNLVRQPSFIWSYIANKDGEQILCIVQNQD